MRWENDLPPLERERVERRRIIAEASARVAAWPEWKRRAFALMCNPTTGG